MNGYDNWLTNDVERENAEMAAEAFEEKMSWPPETDAPATVEVWQERYLEQKRRAVAAREERDCYKAVLREIAHWGISVPQGMTEAQYDRYAFHAIMRCAAQALVPACEHCGVIHGVHWSDCPNFHGVEATS